MIRARCRCGVDLELRERVTSVEVPGTQSSTRLVQCPACGRWTRWTVDVRVVDHREPYTDRRERALLTALPQLPFGCKENRDDEIACSAAPDHRC